MTSAIRAWVMALVLALVPGMLAAQSRPASEIFVDAWHTSASGMITVLGKDGRPQKVRPPPPPKEGLRAVLSAYGLWEIRTADAALLQFDISMVQAWHSTQAVCGDRNPAQASRAAVVRDFDAHASC